MKLVILYGSQTGNAQDLAERVWKQSQQNRLDDVHLSSFDEFKFDTLDCSTRLIGVCSTTGQGDVNRI